MIYGRVGGAARECAMHMHIMRAHIANVQFCTAAISRTLQFLRGKPKA